MTTTRTVHFEYSESPAEVVGLLQDPIFLRYRSEASGERNVDVRIEPSPSETRVTVAREKTIDVPAFARFAVGDANRAVESTLWRKSESGWVAEYTIEVSGVPVKTQGRSTFEPSPRGCKYTSTFEVTAKIPLIGKRIEALVADGLVEQLTNNAERNSAALMRDAARGSRSFIEQLREEAATNRG